jgi:hypothetical protein
MLYEQDRVELKVFTPQNPVRFISARLSGQILSLQSLWPDHPKTFIFNGIELSLHQTFAYYGLHEGDSLIALPREAERSSANSWLHLTRDEDNFKESIQFLLDPTTSGETARLRDLHMARLERRPRAFMKMCNDFSHKKAERRSSSGTRISTQTPTSPSTDALPLLWEMDEVASELGEAEKSDPVADRLFH